MTTLAIIADTHLPRGQRQLPAACRERLTAADLIVHAGDLVRREVLTGLRAYGDVIAVHGNVDEPALRTELPASRRFTVAGVELGLTHDAGPARGRLKRLRARFPGTAAVIFGHSHIPWLEHDSDDGFQIVNPGSPTDRRRQPNFTMAWGEVAAGTVRFALLSLI